MYQVQVLCCETAHTRCLHGVYVTKRKTATVITTHSREAATVAAALCMHTYKTDFSIAQTTPQPSSYVFLHWNKPQKRKCHKKKKRKKHHHPGFEPRTTRQGDSNLDVHLLSFLHDKFSGYVSIRTNRRWEKMTKKRKKRPPQGDDASTV